MNGATTLYLGPDIEILPDGSMLFYPHPNLRILRKPDGAIERTWLHRDHLNSARGVTYASGDVVERRGYYPFGDGQGLEETVGAGPLAPHVKGLYRRRFDAETGLEAGVSATLWALLHILPNSADQLPSGLFFQVFFTVGAPHIVRSQTG